MTTVSIRAGRAAELLELSDELDAVVLPMFAARVQPRGVAGHVDWRLCGRIAHLLRSGLFRGDPTEALLMPAAHRLGVPRVFLFGLGPAAPRDVSRTRERLTDVVRALVEAGAVRHAVGFPVAPGAAPPAETASAVEWAGHWIEALGAWRARVESSVLLDADDVLAAEARPLRSRARDLGLRWSD